MSLPVRTLLVVAGLCACLLAVFAVRSGCQAAGTEADKPLQLAEVAEEESGDDDRGQSAISQIEKRGDLLLSTFTQYVEAIDGELVHFTVRFLEGDAQVASFKAKQHDFESKAQPDS